MSNYDLQAHARYSAAVVVAGDGLSAWSAALAAAGAGKDVLLAVSGPAPAAELTVALVGEVAATDDPHLAALRERVAAVGGEHDGWLEPAIAQLVADQMLAEAGVRLLLWTIPIRIVVTEDRAQGLLCAGKDGLYTIAAGAVVDATADGALCRHAGAAFTCPETIQASRTLYFELAGEDLGGLPEEVAAFDLSLRATWPGEVCVTMTGSAAADGQPVPEVLHRESRLAEQEVAKACRATVPGLAGALATHSGHQMLVLNGPYLSTPCDLPNVIGAGAWVGNSGWGDLTALAACGTGAGVQAAAQALPVPAALDLTESLQLPLAETQVGVFGGGTGGPFAGWAAAHHGAQVTLFEAGWSLGGIATCGGIHCYYHGIPGGLQSLLDAGTDLVADDLGGRQKVGGFHPEARKIVLERALAEVKAKVRYGWTATDVVTEGERITGVVVAAPGQLLLVRPKVAIDGTGDGDLAAAAGAPSHYGRETDGLSHQYSQSAARLHNGTLGHFNFDAGYVDGRSVADLTRARRTALQQYWRPEGFTAAERPFNMSYLLGLRQSRHVVADYMLALDDQVTNRHFPDVVAYGKCHQDNHAFDYELENDDAMLWVWTLGYWKRMMHHELPYRCLIPQGVSNLLMACRAVSVSREAHMLFRMIRDMYRIGEAAGTAAQMALSHHGAVREVNVAELQTRLRDTGALLDDWPAPEAVAEPEALVAELATAQPPVAVWHLYQQGEAAAAALRDGLAADDANTRWWSAVALAMTNQAEAAPYLREILVSRDPQLPTTNPEEPGYYLKRMAPRWVSAMVLLGRLRDREAVPLLAEVLAEPVPEVDWLLAAIRALGRIADPSGAPAVRELLARADLPTSAELQNSFREQAQQARDVKWQLDLTAAAALAEMGDEAPALSAPYLQDDRAYVRAYAARVRD